jgi:hypothetical protein
MGAADCQRDGRVVDAPPGQPQSPNDGAGSALTAFQVDVAQLFFALPASDGFLLAGGAALAAQHLTNRPTQDLDFFTAPGRGDGANVSRLAAPASAALRDIGRSTHHDSSQRSR